MAWWMVAAALASSERVRVEPPEGVEVEVVARELIRRATPAGVVFEVAPAPRVEGGRLVLVGTLRNEGKKPAAVVLRAPTPSEGPFRVAPEGVAFRGTPPRGLEAPEQVVLPPGASMAFHSALSLDDWDWPAGEVTIRWRFAFWDREVEGTLTGAVRKAPAP